MPPTSTSEFCTVPRGLPFIIPFQPLCISDLLDVLVFGGEEGKLEPVMYLLPHSAAHHSACSRGEGDGRAGIKAAGSVTFSSPQPKKKRWRHLEPSPQPQVSLPHPKRAAAPFPVPSVSSQGDATSPPSEHPCGSPAE